MNNPIINIIVRTHNQRDYFVTCMESIRRQTYPFHNVIVGSDVPCDYYPNAIPLKLEYNPPKDIPNGMYYAPWNLHFRELHKYCEDGWVMYLDSDDCFATNHALAEIYPYIQYPEFENHLVIWRVKITDNFIVPRLEDFGKVIAPGNISGIGIMFHSKHLPVDFGDLSYGDFRVVLQLLNKGLQPVFINKILTQTINGPHNGRT